MDDGISSSQLLLLKENPHDQVFVHFWGINLRFLGMLRNELKPESVDAVPPCLSTPLFGSFCSIG